MIEKHTSNRALTPCVLLALIVLVVFLGGAPLNAQSASLVKDINTEGPSFGSEFRQLTAAGGQVFFVAPRPDAGSQLWVSTGTPETTHIVSGICPVDCDSTMTIAGTYGDLALVSARLGFLSPYRLWRSDGSRAGTFPLASSVYLVSPTVLQGTLYMIGCLDDASHCDVWMSDGTQEGTARTSLIPGDPSISRMIAAGGRLFLVALDAPGEAALWSSDGTPGGAQRLGTLGQGTANLLTAAGDRLYLTFAGDLTTALWTSDGTEAGTRALHSYLQGSFADGIQVQGARAWFVARDAADGNELWTSDGTAAGTRRATAFTTEFETIRQVRPLGGRAVFLAGGGSHDARIWSTAGTPASAAAVPDPPCTGCSFVDDGTTLTPFAGRLVFFGTDDAHGAEPWVTDGTAAGTHLVADLCSGECSSIDPLGVAPPVTSQGIVFAATYPPRGAEVWRTDGTAAGTLRLTDNTAPHISFFNEAVTVGARLYFGLSDGVRGPALWVSERPGRAARRTAIVGPQGAGSFPQDLTALGDRLFFLATDGEMTRLWTSLGTAESTIPLGMDAETVFDDWGPTVAGNFLFLRRSTGGDPGTLWRTDGTPAGTVPLKSGVGQGLTSFQGRLWFSATANGHAAIWKSDGTQAGTSSVIELPEDATLASILTGLGPDLYFFTGGDSEQLVLWHSDGTQAGTRQLAELGAFLDVRGYRPGFVRLGGQVFFQVNMIWKTDGTPEGTVPLLVPRDDDASGTYVSHPTVFEGALYFLAAGPTFNERGLWRSDGTAAGTVPVKTFPAFDQGGLFGRPDSLVAGAGRLWISIDDGVHGIELWQSDGTSDGTTMLRDIAPGGDSSNPRDLTVTGGRLLFSAADGAHGRELWQSDGTAEGTRLVQDIAALGASSFPAHLTAAGDRLYFSADDGPGGNELWSLPLSGPACQATDTALCLSGGRYRVTARWRDFQGNTGLGHAAQLTADTGTFWFFDPSNVEVLLKVLDGRPVNGHVWVFYGALSNVEYTLTVTDTTTGLARQYFNPSGQLASVGDIHAFGPLGANATTSPPPSTAENAEPSLPPLVSAQSGRTATVPCEAGPQRLCLNSGRFAVEVSWRDFQGHTGPGTAAALSGDTGTFWFFDAANIELAVKVLDGRPLNGHFWLFYGALSNVEYTVTVTDTQTGAIKTYRNPSGRFASVADVQAF